MGEKDEKGNEGVNAMNLSKRRMDERRMFLMMGSETEVEAN